MTQERLLTLVFTGVAIAALGTAGYALYLGQQPLSAPPPALSNYKTPASSPGADRTADWKTYRNEEYGFEFRYPSDWQGDDGMDQDGAGWIYSRATLDFWKTTDPASLIDVPPDISILILSKPDAAAWQKNYSENEGKQIRVGEKEAILYTTVMPDGKEMRVFIENAGSIISLAATREPSLGIFDQILSTFRFTK